MGSGESLGGSLRITLVSRGIGGQIVSFVGFLSYRLKTLFEGFCSRRHHSRPPNFSGVYCPSSEL